MNKYEAENKKQYLNKDNDLVTAKRKLSYLIDNEWFYSMHWKDDTWIEQAAKDLERRKTYNRKEADELKSAEFILNEIK